MGSRRLLATGSQRSKSAVLRCSVWVGSVWVCSVFLCSVDMIALLRWVGPPRPPTWEVAGAGRRLDETVLGPPAEGIAWGRVAFLLLPGRSPITTPGIDQDRRGFDQDAGGF